MEGGAGTVFWLVLFLGLLGLLFVLTAVASVDGSCELFDATTRSATLSPSGAVSCCGSTLFGTTNTSAAPPPPPPPPPVLATDSTCTAKSLPSLDALPTTPPPCLPPLLARWCSDKGRRRRMCLPSDRVFTFVVWFLLLPTSSAKANIGAGTTPKDKPDTGAVCRDDREDEDRDKDRRLCCKGWAEALLVLLVLPVDIPMICIAGPSNCCTGIPVVAPVVAPLLAEIVAGPLFPEGLSLLLFLFFFRVTRSNPL